MKKILFFIVLGMLIGCAKERPVIVQPVSGTSYNLNDYSFQLFDILLADGDYRDSTITFEWMGGRQPKEINCVGGANVIARCVRTFNGQYTQQGYSYVNQSFTLVITAQRGTEEDVSIVEFTYGQYTNQTFAIDEE